MIFAIAIAIAIAIHSASSEYFSPSCSLLRQVPRSASEGDEGAVPTKTSGVGLRWGRLSQLSMGKAMPIAVVVDLAMSVAVVVDLAMPIAVVVDLAMSIAVETDLAMPIAVVVDLAMSIAVDTDLANIV